LLNVYSPSLFELTSIFVITPSIHSLGHKHVLILKPSLRSITSYKSWVVLGVFAVALVYWFVEGLMTWHIGSVPLLFGLCLYEFGYELKGV